MFQNDEGLFVLNTENAEPWNEEKLSGMFLWQGEYWWALLLWVFGDEAKEHGMVASWSSTAPKIQDSFCRKGHGNDSLGQGWCAVHWRSKTAIAGVYYSQVLVQLRKVIKRKLWKNSRQKDWSISSEARRWREAKAFVANSGATLMQPIWYRETPVRCTMTCCMQRTVD